MTQTGINRAHYAESHAVEDPRPSRFSDPGAYGEWAARADKYAARRARFAAYIEQEIKYGKVSA